MIEPETEVITCAHCDAEIPKDSLFCPKCGKRPVLFEDGTQPAAAANSAVCSRCGQGLVADAPYCWNCGQPVSASLPLAGPAQQYPPVVSAPRSQPAAPVAAPQALPKVETTWRYPFLKLLQLFMRITAVFILLIGAAGILVTVLGSAFVTSRLTDLNPSSTMFLAGGNILVILGTLFTMVVAAFPLFAAAEFLQMFMDIEANQRIQMAWFQRMGFR